MFSRSMFWKLFFPIGIVLIVSAVAAAIYLPYMIRHSAEQDALAAGKETVSQFTKLRQYYTENVIAKVSGKAGFSAAAEHINKPLVLPLPATMIHELSAMFEASGTTLKLYSPYPFPNRKGRVLDKFGEDAWRFLQANPDKAFYRTEMLGDRSIVRVAIADRMTAQACVACHNSVAGSPKTDWKLGDVRGVLEVDSSKQLDSGQHIISQTLAMLTVILLSIAVFLRFAYQRSIARPLNAANEVAHALTDGNAEKIKAIEAIASGNLEQEMLPTQLPQIDEARIADDEIGKLLKSVVSMGTTQSTFDTVFGKMLEALRKNRSAEEQRDWLKTGQNELNALMRGEHEAKDLGQAVLSYLCERVGAGIAALYLYDADLNDLFLTASYAVDAENRLRERIALGAGLIGQAAQERRSLSVSELPSDYLPISSALGQGVPRKLLVIPLTHADVLIGVLEIAAFRNFSEAELEFLEHAREGIAIGFGVTLSRRRTQSLLEQTQQQAEELRVQQEQLQQSNEELEERAHLLEQQREVIHTKHQEVEASSQQLQRKAAELERISNYKSEFLANMSHELRTPLNSMLILSSLLQQNKDGQLNPKQIEYAATIHGAGKDLLNLINDILDLSKIEAGHLELHPGEVILFKLADEVGRLFTPLAEQQKLSFKVQLSEDLPAAIFTDEQRCLQILKNLLSNAFKFTAKGEVMLSIRKAAGSAQEIDFEVRDSGIGIAPDKQEQIFHAFQQADGSTSRKYGGTGLGLSISRQLAQRMGGRITLLSELEHGSSFTLSLPVNSPLSAATTVLASDPELALPASVQITPVLLATRQTVVSKLAPPGETHANLELPAAALEDDRDKVRAGVSPGERVILVVEDDLNFAGVLRDTVRQHGFHAIVACDGESGLALIEAYTPNAIILDVMLPHIDGWGVMRSIKDNPRTRHIPVHFITCLEDRRKALSMGAVGFVTKPVSAEQLGEVFNLLRSAIDQTAKKLLLIENDEAESKNVTALLEMGGLEIVIARSGQEALQRMQQENFDCVVLDLGLNDMSGFDLLDRLKQQGTNQNVPVIVHSARSLSNEDERRLRHYSESIIIKGAKSPERLLNEVSLFLHMVETSLPQEKQNMIRRALDKEAMFELRKVLLVDDDMRNIFSLSSALADKGMQIVEATNGREALSELDAHADVDIVLMDIMMPEIDGYEAIRQIRKDPRFTRLPIIALTAKAMVSDQKRCLEAGASDYIAKPVNLDRLFSLMRVWLYQD